MYYAIRHFTVNAISKIHSDRHADSQADRRRQAGRQADSRHRTCGQGGSRQAGISEDRRQAGRADGEGKVGMTMVMTTMTLGVCACVHCHTTTTPCPAHLGDRCNAMLEEKRKRRCMDTKEHGMLTEGSIRTCWIKRAAFMQATNTIV